MEVINNCSDDIIGGDLACIAACGIFCYLSAMVGTSSGLAFMMF